MAGGNRGIKYAEEQLRVHDVYCEAQAHADALEKLRIRAAELRASRRYNEDLLEDRSYEVLIEVRQADPSASQAAIERKHKESVHGDIDCRRHRGMLAALARELDDCEAGISTAKVRLEIATARMTELGGYLHYLAALKTASAPAGQTDNWPPDSA